MAGTLTVDTVKSSVSTPTVFQNTSGTEIGQLTRCWVNYAASSTTLSASFNCSSLTRSSAGQYVVNFSTTLTDTKYATIVGLSAAVTYSLTTGAWFGGITVNASNVLVNKTASAVNVCSAYYNGPGVSFDSPDYSVTFNR